MKMRRVSLIFEVPDEFIPVEGEEKQQNKRVLLEAIIGIKFTNPLSYIALYPLLRIASQCGMVDILAHLLENGLTDYENIQLPEQGENSNKVIVRFEGFDDYISPRTEEFTGENK
jgi:hypothetical protein